MKIPNLLINILILVLIHIEAAQAFEVIRPYAAHWSVENGLPSNYVYGISQDKLNRVWLATPNGVSIIDGVGITNLKKDSTNSSSISSNAITHVAAKDSEMWILSLNGIDLVDIHTLKARHIFDPKGLLNRANNVHFFKEFAWVISRGRLLQIDYKTRSIKNISNIGLDNQIQVVSKINKGTFLITSEKGYAIYDSASEDVTPVFLNDFNPQHHDIRASIIDPKGRLWLSILGKGILVFENGKLSHEFNVESKTMLSNMISQFFIDDNLLYAVTGKGVEIFNVNNLNQRKTILPDSFNSKYLNAEMALSARILADDSLMIGTTLGAFRISLKPSFKWLSQESRVPLNKSIGATISSADTLFTFNKDEVIGHKISNNFGIHSKEVANIGYSSSPYKINEDILVYESGLIAQFNNNKIIPLQVDELPQNVVITTAKFLPKLNLIILISKNQLFVVRQNKNKLQLLNTLTFPGTLIVDIAVMGERIFFASQKVGIQALSTSQLLNSFAKFEEVDGPKVPIDLYIDHQNNLWALTFDDGLYLMKPSQNYNKFEKFTFGNSDNLEQVICLTQDYTGRFWFSARYGISTFLLSDKKLRSFSQGDGLKPQSFKRFECGRVGEQVYFSADRDVVIVDTKSALNQPQSIEIKLAQMSLEQNVLKQNEKRLFIEPNLLTFTLSSPTLLLTQQDKIQYRLVENSNKYSQSIGRWIETPRPEINLVRPNTGNFQLQTRIKRFDGTVSSVYPIDFSITLPFWRTPLMFSLYLIVAVLVVSLLFSYKLRLKNSKLKLVELRAKQQNLYTEKLAKEVQEKTKGYREQQQLAIKANLEKTRFIASSSHDLRAPLNAIRWKLEQVLPHEHVDKPQIMEELMLLDGLVESIVNLSKFDAKIITPNISSFCLRELLNEVCHRFTSVANEKNIELIIDLDVENISVLSDRFLLSRVLNNLVDNAIKNLESQGFVSITCKTKEGDVCLSVQDNGPGIPSHIQSKLFESFVRGTEKYPGSGLGLTIVKQIAEILKLELCLVSNQQGSHFYMQLPQVTSLESQITNNVKKSALLIDDDPFYANSIANQLQSMGYNLTIIDDMKLIDHIGNKNRFELIVCDFNLGLPRNGLQILRYELQDIVLTAKNVILISEDFTVKELLEHGEPIYFLNKPIKRSRLAWLLQQSDN
ncbi:hybrid sensor histidine kinase/response regulator [Litorilituus lipolyticus]|uniref:histidine kinase n=1 Tax=Litorilituus lipolyticus TaxID=2491017 RepID=A0A502L0A1_9GAMM|nr:hybrid sensor histidine kinase/response regulator [Litorilituus lipolyticus]TPH17116.1 hybrid sensor histidine kinase/response regulator [Litorilituus lipolyticus]